MNKQILLSGCALLFVASVFGQKAKVQSAYNYLRYNELDKAKENIDAATLDPTTAIMAKTWMYRGQIYYAIGTSKDTAIKSLHANPLEESYNSFSKAYEFDTKKIDINELNTHFGQLISPSFNRALDYYNKKEYAQAVPYFERCALINQKFNILDTLSYFNAGLSAEKGQKYDDALKFYDICLKTGYAGPTMYSNIAHVYRLKGQKTEALGIIKQGREKYPNNQDIINYEFSIYLDDNDFEGALKSIDASISNSPNNPIYHYNKGFLYDQKKDIDNAATSYSKALELDPGYFDAYYNMGALYFNKGADLINESNDLPLNQAAKSDELRKQAEGFFGKALPFLEKAHSLRPDDKNTMISLKNIYARTNQNEKYKEINDKLKN